VSLRVPVEEHEVAYVEISESVTMAKGAIISCMVVNPICLYGNLIKYPFLRINTKFYTKIAFPVVSLHVKVS
jgi:hypothetical protein